MAGQTDAADGVLKGSRERALGTRHQLLFMVLIVTQQLFAQSEEITVEIEKQPEHRYLVHAMFEVPTSLQRVWTVLTAYEQIPRYSPTITLSERQPAPNGQIILRQIGTIKLLKIIPIDREVFLQVHERFLESISFYEIDQKQFLTFKGVWQLKKMAKDTTRVEYNLEVQPYDSIFNFLSKTMIIALSEEMLQGVRNELIKN